MSSWVGEVVKLGRIYSTICPKTYVGESEPRSLDKPFKIRKNINRNYSYEKLITKNAG